MLSGWEGKLRIWEADRVNAKLRARRQAAPEIADDLGQTRHTAAFRLCVCIAAQAGETRRALAIAGIAGNSDETQADDGWSPRV